MYDVIIIGGGPAGATAAALLAQQGVSAIVLEKERFPRFHIGESLLPGDVPVLERLGLGDQLAQFLRKGGAEFWDERSGRQSEFCFADGLPGAPTYAYQVERATFDKMLLDHARGRGAEVVEGEKVMAVAIDDAGVTVTSATRTTRGRFVVDATGQDALFGRRAGHIQPYHGFGKAAVFCHFDGLGEVAQAELYRTGNIRIHTLEDGWAWVIPLAGARLSVGLVSNLKGLSPERLATFIAESPSISALTVGCTRSEATIIRNFSYKNRGPAGARFACIGDAACFLDPLFSSGVSLAMVSAEKLADQLVVALADGREADPELMKPATDFMERAYASFGNLIYRFYHTHLADNVFFAPADLGAAGQVHRAGVISLLACDLWRDDNAFQELLIKANRHDPVMHTDASDVPLA